MIWRSVSPASASGDSMQTAKILVATGDYDVLQRIRGAFASENVTIQPTYSHLDAIYLLNIHHFDGAFIDSAMSDRRTGEPTYAVFNRVAQDIPRVIYMAQSAMLNQGPAKPVNGTLTVATLDDRSLQRAVRYIMRRDSGSLATGGIGDSTALETEAHWTPEEVQTFLRLTQSLTQVLELSEVLNRVVTAARDLTNAEAGMILLPDGDNDQLYLRARVGMDINIAQNFRVKTEDNLAGYVYRHGEPALVGHSGPQKVKTEYFVKSLLYVPIMLNGKPIGVLGVNNKQRDDTFTERHQALLLNMAAFAAIGIENARVHGQSVKRARELKLLVDASERMNETLALDSTLRTVCDQIVTVLNVHDAMLLEWDAQRSSLRLVSRRRQLIWRAGQEPTLRLREYDQIRQVTEKSRLVLVRLTDPSEESELLRNSGAGSMLILPVSSSGQMVGVLLAYAVNENALNMAHVSDEIHKSIRTLALKVVSELSKGRERSGTVITRTMDEINSLIGSDWCDLGIGHDGDKLTIQASVGMATWMQSRALTLELSAGDPVRDAVTAQNLLNAHRSGPDVPETLRRLMDYATTNMLLGLPLMQRGTVSGLMLVGDSEHDHFFSPREVDLARAFVHHAASSLDNARLYHDLQDSLQELKATQSRLIKAERLSAMGELSAAVAHQINNPLAAILSNSQLLLEAASQESPQFEVLDSIVRSTKRASAVVRRLLGAVRSSPADRYDDVDVTSTITETLALVRPHIYRAGVRLIEHLPDRPLPMVYAVPGELEDVWLNLMLNAADALAGSSGGEIGLAAEASGERGAIVVTVWDNGPGIPESIRTQIFEPFFTTKPRGEGTGLGLHIAKQVIDRVGGTIRVESVVGSGTQFIVTLPVRNGEAM